MITTYTYRNETWIDVDRGTPEEIHKLMDTYRIDPFVAKELTSATRKPRVEFHQGYVYCILHFPAWKHSHGPDTNQEIDCIIGPGLLITARYDTIDALHKFGKDVEVKEILEKEKGQESSLRRPLFIDLLRELYVGLGDELTAIEDETEDITSHIFQGDERQMVTAISSITRTLLDFKKTVDLHRDVLESLAHHGKKFLGEDFSKGMESILLDYLKINSTIHAELDMLRELRETNNSLLTTKQNETVKQLTVMGFLILPLNFIAVLFGMSFHYLPFSENPHAFSIVIIMMLAISGVTLTYAKYKEWI